MDIDRYTLHRARVTAGLSLEDLATRTRISPGLLKLIDDGQLDRLPGGIYARSYVRAVAKVLGIDADEAVRALAPLMREAQWGAEAGTEAADDGAANRAAAPRTAPAPPPAQAFNSWTARDDDWRRWAASAVDGALLAGVWTMLWAVARAAAPHGGPMPGAGSLAAVSVAASLLAAIYFVVFAGLGGATPGDQAMSLAAADAREPVAGSRIGRRATASFLVKASIVVDAVYTTEWALDALRIKSVE